MYRHQTLASRKAHSIVPVESKVSCIPKEQPKKQLEYLVKVERGNDERYHHPNGPQKLQIQQSSNVQL